MDAVVNSDVRAVAEQQGALDAAITAHESLGRHASVRARVEAAITAYLAASPQPANPAQVTDALREALVLMVDAFLSRNGGSFPMDEVTEEQRLWKKAMKAAYAVIGQPRTRERDEKLAAIGAGGQTVADAWDRPIEEISRIKAGKFFDGAPSHKPIVAGDREKFIDENWNSWREDAIAEVLALSQPHPADERVVEAASAVLKWLDGGCSSWGVPEQQIRILALSAKEGR